MQAIDGDGRAFEQRLAIRELVDRYCDAVNRRDAAAWLDTWAEEPSWELFGRPMHGRHAIATAFENALGMLRLVVQTAANGVLELDGERARGRWLISEWSESDALGRLLLHFVYHDEYARGADGWRFLSRRMELLYQGPPDLSGRSFPPGAGAGR